MGFPFYKQFDAMDCGPTCLRMIARYYGRSFTLQYLRDNCFITREGVSLLGIGQAAEKIGFRSLPVKITMEQLDEEVPLPCILHWNKGHFVVLPPQNYSAKKKKQKIIIADPAHGIIKVDQQTFLESWIDKTDGKGIALLLEPSAAYSAEENVGGPKGLSYLYNYLTPYRRYILQLFFGVICGSILSLIFPFLTQSLVDHGINKHNLGFVYLVLCSQLILFLGSTAIDIIRSWVLLHMNTRINISIISDFLIKLMKLPVRFFDTRMIGDITQRISDHNRIEHFLTSATLNTIFSLFNLLVFSVVMMLYSWKVLMVFLVGSICSIGWILFFMKRRRELDYKKFQQMSSSQNNVYELITGMQEIKLHNCEVYKRWEWERIQIKLFKLNVKGMTLEQAQKTGNIFIGQLKNILISYLSAREVMNGNITLGMMMSISYIVGQMNSPIDQLLEFVRSAQDARISLDRLGEIHDHKNEEEEKPAAFMNSASTTAKYKSEGQFLKDAIRIENLSFQYEGPMSPYVIRNLNMTIPAGKVTAIVGASGSGKTTLMKLLLNFYEPVGGSIHIDDVDMKHLSPSYWRSKCGVVMQNGYVFSDTITRNIAVGSDDISPERLHHAINVANIGEFLNKMPLGFETKIGNTGNGVSAGQQQRILIARAVYKQPEILFFDEATSALDANNEKVIMNNLQRFFKDRTVVIIAHRLSTVKAADQIIVLDNGEIVEEGRHDDLSRRRGRYFELVKNQLELGN